MRRRKKTDEIAFTQGYRKDAIAAAIKMVKKSGRSAQLVICRDIPGKHTGGDDCFCDPLLLELYPEDLE